MLMKFDNDFYWSRTPAEMDRAFTGRFDIKIDGVDTPVIGYGRTEVLRSYIHLYERWRGKLLMKSNRDLKSMVEDSDDDLLHLGSLARLSDEQAYLIVPRVGNDGVTIHFHAVMYGNIMDDFRSMLLSKYCGVGNMQSEESAKVVARVARDRMDDLNKIVQFARIQAAPLSHKHTFSVKDGAVVCESTETGFHAIDLSKCTPNVNIPKEYIMEDGPWANVDQDSTPWDQ